MPEAPLVAEVLILRRARQLAEPFDYSVPSEFREKLTAGMLVRVPLRHSEAVGLVTALKEEKSRFKELELKPLIEILEGAPCLQPYQVEVLKWLSEYYIESPGSVVSLFFPQSLPSSLEKVVSLRSSDAPPEIYRLLVESGGTATYSFIKKRLGSRADRLLYRASQNDSVKISWVVKQVQIRPRVTYDILLADVEQLEKLRSLTRSKRLKAFLTELAERHIIGIEEAREYFGVSISELKRLETSGALKLHEKFKEEKHERVETFDRDVELTIEQKKAVEEITASIKSARGAEFLLFGPTGSGKTEVYLRAAEKALQMGKQVIYLVPEISLTPQTYSRIERRFPEKTSVFHSGLKSGERINQWLQVATGAKEVVVGARSAIFLPFRNPGLIIVDEEHDSSYRQDASPVYDARMVARKIAGLTGATVVFGSATPSVERMYEATSGRIRLLRLSKRVSGKMPVVRLVDLKGKKELLTEEMKEGILKTVENRKKAIIFLNRRGYSVVEVCKDCGYLATCLRCSVFLRYHRDISKLVCHYCGYSKNPDSVCPECNGRNIALKGKGIQQVEEQIQELLGKKAKAIRLDSDVRGKKGKSRIYEFYSKETSVLVGTQMIAKGIHLPEVTFAGVVNADVGLNIPDFRSEERTFQLIVQLIGRVGRGEEPGEVLIQSFQPERQVINHAVKGDYLSFYRDEIELRRINELPPFFHLIRILSVSSKERDAIEIAEKVNGCLLGSVKEYAKIVGPVPAPIYRLHGKYRVQILLKVGKSPDEKILSAVRRCCSLRTSKARVIVEVDPLFVA